METKNRNLTITLYDHHSRLILQGLWFEKYGFRPGDKVVVSSIAPGQLMIKIERQAATPALDESANQQKPTKVAESTIDYYRSLFPRPAH